MKDLDEIKTFEELLEFGYRPEDSVVRKIYEKNFPQFLTQELNTTSSN